MIPRWVFLVVLIPAAPAAAADWPQFRGPDRSGVSKETGLPLEWSATKNILWKRELPGPGSSSPVVFGDHVYVTCYSGYGLDMQSPGNLADLKRHLVCVDRRTGTVLWTRAEVDPDGSDAPYKDSNIALHGYASHTPAADASGVYAYFGAAGAVCYSHDGEKKWGPMRLGRNARVHTYGTGASPLLYGNLFIVNALEAAVERESLPALDAFVDPPPGVAGFDAAAAAEICPVGPALDGDDDERLMPLVERFNRDRKGDTDPAVVGPLLAPITDHYAPLLRRAWDLLWRCRDREAALPEARSVGRRWDADRDAFRLTP